MCLTKNMTGMFIETAFMILKSWISPRAHYKNGRRGQEMVNGRMLSAVRMNEL